MRVNAHHVKIVFLDYFLGIINQLMPDAKAGGRPTYVRFASASAAATRVEAQADVVAWEQLPKLLDLVYRAKVDRYSLLY